MVERSEKRFIRDIHFLRPFQEVGGGLVVEHVLDEPPVNRNMDRPFHGRDIVRGFPGLRPPVPVSPGRRLQNKQQQQQQ